MHSPGANKGPLRPASRPHLISEIACAIPGIPALKFRTNRKKSYPNIYCGMCGRSLTGEGLTKMERMKRDVYENPDELIAFLQDLKKERESKGSQIFSSD